jgi:hypothetical protein
MFEEDSMLMPDTSDGKFYKHWNKGKKASIEARDKV